MTRLPGDEATGVVAEYDDHLGAGEVELADGGRLWFHCTALRDGSRHVDPGTAVRLRVAAGHLGRLEGADLEVLADGR